MKVVHALDYITPSIFLAGPTPRNDKTISWRIEALELLKDYPGTIYVPESDSWSAHDNYDAQIHWELLALNAATRIVFWIPRDIEHMPAFTTNVEFGKYISSGKCILGYPELAPKMKYLHFLAEKFNIPIYSTLEDTLKAAVDLSIADVHSSTKKESK